MKFFEKLRRGRHKPELIDPESRRKLLEAWGLSEDLASSRIVSPPPPVDPVAPRELAYDRNQWHRRLKTILDELPDTEDQWEHLVSDARAKGFDPGWVHQTMRDEFVLMVRAAVADRVFTERERRKLEQARYLIGIPEDEAESTYQTVFSEAETFFGGAIEGI